MGRSPCCDKVGLKKGPWTPEEDQKLLAYIEEHGHGSWRALPAKAGLQRCGKSCRLRWTNYLRPDIKRGKFSLQEEQTIIQLHALLGNRWSAIATHLPKRTDNEIKNYWNTHLKKRLAKMGIDPVTHKPKNDTLLSSDGQSKSTANLSHMAQWESARLEAEARLVRESKLRSLAFQNQDLSPPPNNPQAPASSSAAASQPHSLDMLKAWNGSWSAKQAVSAIRGQDLESPTSTLTFSENGNGNGNTNAPPIMGAGIGENINSPAMFEFVGTSGSSETGILKEEGDQDHWKSSLSLPSFASSFHDMTLSTMEASHDAWTTGESLRTGSVNVVDEGFTNLLLNNSDNGRSLSDSGGRDSDNGCSRSEYEDNKNYWNSILNLVNSSPSESPMF